jgi:hypothetical protein
LLSRRSALRIEAVTQVASTVGTHLCKIKPKLTVFTQAERVQSARTHRCLAGRAHAW